MKTVAWSQVLSVVLMMMLGFGATSGRAVDSGSVKALFANPPRQYSSGPLWVWNDMLTEEQIASTLRDLAEQNVKQVFVHPRPGLMTPYLSDDWFRLWKVALKEARRLDMNIWIYDENSYPSGFAGGLVPEAMPQSRGQGLDFKMVTELPELCSDIIAVYRVDGDAYANITEQIKRGEKLGRGEDLLARRKWGHTSPWYGGKFYVDLTKPTVTKKFLEITLDEYERRIGDEFGKRIPGVFTDEPHLRPVGDLHWTDDLEDVFSKRWGYSLVHHLPSLVRPVGDWKRVRHNYYQLLLELFIERWAKPYYEYCEKNNLEFTGHYWEHEWPNCVSVQDNMAMSAWQQRPAIDTLMNQYREDTHAQFGNVRAVKELSSVANQLGRSRTLCEAYGAGGWDLRFEDMKRIGDWLFVLGVNTLNEHLSFITIRGARKRDHPQSFSYHEPWWQAYHVLASYFTRLSAVLSQGDQINTILFIEPTTTAWMYQADSSHKENLSKLGDKFQEIVVDLAKAQVEFDIGCEDIIARHGLVKGKTLEVGNRRYATVVIPPLTENLNTKTMELIEVYAKAGGKVLCCGAPPSLVEGVPSRRGTAVSQSPSFRQLEPDKLLPLLSSRHNDGFVIGRDDQDKGILYHHRRRLDDGEILFLVNTSIDSPASGQIQSRLRGVENWDPATGDTSSYPFETGPGGVTAGFELAPCGSLLLFLSDGPKKPGPADSARTVNVTAAGPVRVERIESNVLTLDYVDVTAGGETRKNVYFDQASAVVWQKHGLPRNPWDSSVQFRDEMITREFPPDSGFEAAYRFVIEDNVPESLYIVIERSDLYTISCNGEPVSAVAGSWWLDKAFGKINIRSAAQVGENVVTIKAQPMTIYHELEPAYVLGGFALKAVDSGFVIVPTAPLKLGPWNEQGHPFYAAGVSYAQDFDVPKPQGEYFVSLPNWYGSVAQVIVNGEKAGYIYCRPWECDVTEQITAGKNNVEVVVIGTLKNTLGPHHAGSVRGSAWPNMFKKAPQTGPPPGKQYDTIGYGLFKAFELERRS